MLAGCGRDARDDTVATTTITTTTVTSTTVPAEAATPLPAPVACYSGPPGTNGVGACRGGVRTFAGGPCVGEVVPTPESCNGEDDDCNGVVDDGLGTMTCGVGACETRAPAC